MENHNESCRMTKEATIKKMVKRLEKRGKSRRYTIAQFLAMGGMPWLV